MPGDGPELNGPRSPYVPSRVDDEPGNGRTLVALFALLLAAMLLLASLARVVSLLG